jgi:hypothetical protein
MITRIFNNGVSNDLTLSPIEELFSIALEFDSEKSRDEFCSQFPKYMKVRARFISSYDYSTGKMKIIKTPYCNISISGTNKVTGDANETGDKRLTRFYNALKAQLQKEAGSK